MDEHARKTALRMIPYGLYVLTAESSDGEIAAATVDWVTQTSFTPPLVVVGVKVGSGTHAVMSKSEAFALNILGKGQQGVAYAFFKPTKREGQSLNGEAFYKGSTGAPILTNVPAYVECKRVETVDIGDHSIFVGEVVDAGIAQVPAGRPDAMTLTLRDLGEKVFYGG